MTQQRSLRHDERGALSWHLLVFLGSLVIGAILYILLEPMAMTFVDLASSRTNTQAAAEGQRYVRFAFGNMHLIVIGIGLLQLFAAAVYEGQV